MSSHQLAMIGQLKRGSQVRVRGEKRRRTGDLLHESLDSSRRDGRFQLDIVHLSSIVSIAVIDELPCIGRTQYIIKDTIGNCTKRLFESVSQFERCFENKRTLLLSLQPRSEPIRSAKYDVAQSFPLLHLTLLVLLIHTNVFLKSGSFQAESTIS